VTLLTKDEYYFAALAAASGALFPPVVFVDGRPFSHGRLSERKLRKALGGV
jgi:hypothetical protein